MTLTAPPNSPVDEHANSMQTTAYVPEAVQLRFSLDQLYVPLTPLAFAAMGMTSPSQRQQGQVQSQPLLSRSQNIVQGMQLAQPVRVHRINSAPHPAQKQLCETVTPSTSSPWHLQQAPSSRTTLPWNLQQAPSSPTSLREVVLRREMRASFLNVPRTPPNSPVCEIRHPLQNETSQTPSPVRMTQASNTIIQRFSSDSDDSDSFASETETVSEYSTTEDTESNSEMENDCPEIPIDQSLSNLKPIKQPKTMTTKNSEQKRKRNNSLVANSQIHCSNPNCRATSSPTWRFMKRDYGKKKPFCNACKLFFDKNRKHRPLKVCQGPASQKRAPRPTFGRVCWNCKTTETCTWRFIEDKSYCNACGQHQARHGYPRPC
jgi:ribosomal protein L34E